MRFFKHKHFSEWAVDEGIKDKDLIKSALEISQGLFEANFRIE